MDFAWVVDALRRGLKVTRKAWAGDPPMYLYTSKTKNGKHTVMVCNGSTVDREACFYPDAVLDATDWEEYVEPKKEKHAHQGDTPYFDSICKGCFNCLWRKKGQTDCGGHPNLIKNAAGIVTECSSWVRRPDMTEESHDKQARKDWTDCAGGVVHCGEDTGYMAEQLELLVDIYAEKISQRVAQLLQKTDVPLSNESSDHV